VKRHTWTVREDELPTTLEAFLAGGLGEAVELARARVGGGSVYVGGRRCTDPVRRLKAGDAVSAILAEGGRSALSPLKETYSPTVLFLDDWIVALDKPPGMTSQPTPGRVGESLWDWVRQRYGVETRLVHRLDRETSGVMLFVRAPSVVGEVTAQFRERGVRKEYLAITAPGIPERGTVEFPISRDPTRLGRFRASAGANGLPARTDYERLFETPVCAGLLLQPHTGRTHQLRAHLAALGFPIAGDVLYGGPPTLGETAVARCLLHARRLELGHPKTGERLRLEAPLPGDLASLWRGPA
jgi:23S rRNA pseudouridine1911/1915/1917 synthase